MLSVDHVGVAVADLEAAVATYRDAFGLPEPRYMEVPEQKVRVATFEAGGTRLELLCPIGADGPIAKFIETRGPGLHHVALRVDDLTTTIERLKNIGMKVIDETPREGADGARIAFVHPKSTGGVLIELVSRGAA